MSSFESLAYCIFAHVLIIPGLYLPHGILRTSFLIPIWALFIKSFLALDQLPLSHDALQLVGVYLVIAFIMTPIGAFMFDPIPQRTLTTEPGTERSAATTLISGPFTRLMPTRACCRIRHTTTTRQACSSCSSSQHGDSALLRFCGL